MKNEIFEKETFIKNVKNTVKSLFRKELSEASQQEIYQAVSFVVKEVIIDQWLATQKTMEKTATKITRAKTEKTKKFNCFIT